MFKPIKFSGYCSALLLTLFVAQTGWGQVPMPLPMYVTQPPVVVAGRPAIHHGACCSKKVRVQVGYPAYFAPQVPVVPVVPGPVQTVSAYYVPTVPVVQSFYAPVVPVHKVRRYSVPVAPMVIHPVYWFPY